MAKWWSAARLLQLRLSSLAVGVLLAVAAVQLLASQCAYNYPHTPREDIAAELLWETVPNLPRRPSIPPCTYDHVLNSDHTIQPWEVPKQFNDFSAKGLVNGSYVPEHCNPQLSVALLVTYRNRQSQLDIFLPYMHNFLRKQNIHYKIFVIEQEDDKPWNKGLLYNVGARRAATERFPCLVLHDVDLLPLDAGNLYACARAPRHMSASIDKFRYVLPYSWLVGGALSLPAAGFAATGGLSLRFTGWGGEDDDFYHRLVTANLTVTRWPRTMSRYTMLVHRPEPRNAERGRLLAEARRTEDGLRAADRAHTTAHHLPLYTRLAVRL